MKRLAAIGILCAAAGAAMAEGPAASQPGAVMHMVPPVQGAGEAQAQEDRTRSMNKLTMAIERAMSQQFSLRKEREGRRDELLKLTGRSDEKGVLDAIRELEDTSEKAQLAEKMKETRGALIEQKIASIANDIQARSEKDMITKELQKIVEAKEHDAALLLDAKVAAQREIEVAQRAAAEARVRLLERREALGAAVYGDTLKMLNQEHVRVLLDADEQQQLLIAVDVRLKKLRQGRPDCDKIREDDEAIARIQTEVDRLHWERLQVERTGL